MRQQRMLCFKMNPLYRETRAADLGVAREKSKRTKAREEALIFDRERKGTVRDREKVITTTEVTRLKASLRQEQEIRRQRTVFASNKQRIGDVIQRFHVRKQRGEETNHWEEHFVRNPIVTLDEL